MVAASTPLVTTMLLVKPHAILRRLEDANPSPRRHQQLVPHLCHRYLHLEVISRLPAVH
jgi:hypothetical protein